MVIEPVIPPDCCVEANILQSDGTEVDIVEPDIRQFDLAEGDVC